MMRAAALLALAASGCCDDKVDSRIFVGHLTQGDCLEASTKNQPPVTLVCPGTEVTLCWASNKAVTIDATDDALNLDGPAEVAGVKYFTPTKDTEVEVRASDCAKSRRKVTVVDKPLELPVDAGWANACQALTFDLNPCFYDPKLHVDWIEARFAPRVWVWDDPAGGGPGQWETCSYPPFLYGDKFNSPPHPFTIPMPFSQTQFATQPIAIGKWWMTNAFTCPSTFTCNPLALVPFRLGLTCTPSRPD